MKNTLVNSAWPFYVDHVENYAFYKEAFSIEECNKIISIGKNNSLEKATTLGKKTKNYRNSNIFWIYPNSETEWIFRKLTDIILDLNSNFFKFELYGMVEGLQFTHYKQPDGQYKKHVDRALNTKTRKLSISIQLSNPKSYKGGELYLYGSEEGDIVPKEQGTLIAFPSYSLHEVKPVTKGERFSLVCWITGPAFK